MSYSAQISFKSINQDKIQSFLKDYKKTVIEHLKDIASQENFYLPYIRRNYSEVDTSMTLFRLHDLDRTMKVECEYWIHRLFQYRCLYITKLGLFAMYGVPNCCQNLFDGTVYFQNSCDQDYELKYWEGIEPFEHIYHNQSIKTDDEIDKLVKCECNDLIIEKIDYDYYRRTYCYKEIWNYLEDSLYNDNEAIYISLFNYFDFNIRDKFFKYCLETYEE